MWRARMQIRGLLQGGLTCTRTSIGYLSCCLGIADIEDRGFDLPTFVDTAFKKLRSDVHLTAELMIGVCNLLIFVPWHLISLIGSSGEYATTLSYTQLSVPITTDSSMNLMLPVLAQPIVQKIVGGSVLGYVSQSALR